MAMIGRFVLGAVLACAGCGGAVAANREGAASLGHESEAPARAGGEGESGEGSREPGKRSTAADVTMWIHGTSDIPSLAIIPFSRADLGRAALVLDGGSPVRVRIVDLKDSTLDIQGVGVTFSDFAGSGVFDAATGAMTLSLSMHLSIAGVGDDVVLTVTTNGHNGRAIAPDPDNAALARGRLVLSGDVKKRGGGELPLGIEIDSVELNLLGLRPSPFDLVK
jgi:hypothetical protein